MLEAEKPWVQILAPPLDCVASGQRNHISVLGKMTGASGAQCLTCSEFSEWKLACPAPNEVIRSSSLTQKPQSRVPVD